MRFVHATIVAAVICASAPAAHAYVYGYWSAETKAPTQTSDCSCGHIVGVARTLPTWVKEGGGTHVNVEGPYGAKWGGEEYPLSYIIPVNGVSDEVICAYRCNSGSLNNDKLSVDWSATAACSGTAVILNPADSQWWWKPTVNITDDKPVVEMKVSGGDWLDVAITADPDPDPVTPGNQNDIRTAALFTWTPIPPPPGQQSTTPLANAQNLNGKFLGTTTISNHAVATLVRARAVLHVTVSGESDNAKVTDWITKVNARLTTDLVH